jgi:hypothetical protein
VRKYNIKSILSGKPPCKPFSFPKCAALRLITSNLYFQSLTAIWTRTSLLSSSFVVGSSTRFYLSYSKPSSFERRTFQRAAANFNTPTQHLSACPHQHTSNTPEEEPFSVQEPCSVRPNDLALLKIPMTSFRHQPYPRSFQRPPIPTLPF